MGELQRQHQDHLARRARLFRPMPLPFAPVIAEPIEAEIIPLIPRTGRDVLHVSSKTPRSSSEQFRLVTKFVGKEFGVSASDIISERRTANVVLPRQIVMYLMKETTTRSLPYIGRRIGDRDHTTVLHGVRKITKLIRENAELACTIAHLEAQLTQ